MKTPLTDGEHCAIINRYREWKSMAKVARAYRVSPATVHAHIKLHNKLIRDSGDDMVCEKCWNAGDTWVATDFVETRPDRRFIEEEEQNVVTVPADQWRRMERKRVNEIMMKRP